MVIQSIPQPTVWDHSHYIHFSELYGQREAIVQLNFFTKFLQYYTVVSSDKMHNV